MRKQFTHAYKRWDKYSRMRIEVREGCSEEFQEVMAAPASPIFASRLSTHFPTKTVQSPAKMNQQKVKDEMQYGAVSAYHQGGSCEIIERTTRKEGKCKQSDQFDPFPAAEPEREMPVFGCGLLTKGRQVINMSKKAGRGIWSMPHKLRRKSFKVKWRRPHKKQEQQQQQFNMTVERPMARNVNEALQDLYRVAKPNLMFTNVMNHAAVEMRSETDNSNNNNNNSNKNNNNSSNNNNRNNNNYDTENVYASVGASPWASHREPPPSSYHYDVHTNNYVSLKHEESRTFRYKGAGHQYLDQSRRR